MDKKLGKSGQAPNGQEVGGTGQASNGQEVGEIRPSAQWTRGWGNQAKRPMDKKLGKSGQAPNGQEIKGVLESLSECEQCRSGRE
ncbi:MAG: hypothetical protein RBU37_07795 [Myxococcota bacterium]|nr:hypothetical protein [Myxococcota bacterium]